MNARAHSSGWLNGSRRKRRTIIMPEIIGAVIIIWAMSRIIRAASGNGWKETEIQFKDDKGEVRTETQRVKVHTAFEVWTARIFLIVVGLFVFALLADLGVV